MKESDIYTKILTEQERKIYLDKYCKEWVEKENDFVKNDYGLQYLPEFVSTNGIDWTKEENML